jgi:NitT/TauT family transport system substrate-binding protein
MSVIIQLQKYALCALLTAGLLLSACQLPGKKQSHPKMVMLKVARSSAVTYTPLFIAQEEGYFAEQGLQVEFVRMMRSADALPALIQGELDVTGDFVGFAYLNAIARGARIKFVADKGYIAPTGCDSNAFVASRALIESGELKGPAQLKGRKIGANPRSASAYFVEKLLNTAALTLDDVEVVDIPQAVMGQAIGKNVDVAFLMEPSVIRAVQANQGVVWKTTQQVAPDFQVSYILYGPALLEKNPDAGRRFMIAYLKAVRQYNQGKTERNLEIIAKHTGQDRELLKQACWAPFREDGKINLQSVLDFQAWAVKRGFLDTSLTTDQFWEPGFVEYANRVLDTANH